MRTLGRDSASLEARVGPPPQARDVAPTPPTIALNALARRGQCQLRDTVPPTPVRPARRTLERGRRSPRKGYGHLSRAHAGQHRDVKPVERVSSVTVGSVQPFPSLCHHPVRCSTIPDAVGTRDDKTSPRPLLCILRSSVSCTLESAYERRPNGKLPRSHPRSRAWAATGLAMTPDGNKIRQDGYLLHGTVHHSATRSLNCAA
jgi:hypothetical protein